MKLTSIIAAILAFALAVRVCLGVDGESQSRSFTMRGYDARIQDGIDLIYNLEFEPADAYFEAIIDREPENPLGYFFLAMVTWWRVLIDLEDRTHDEQFYNLLEDCIEVCDRRLEDDPDDFDGEHDCGFQAVIGLVRGCAGAHSVEAGDFALFHGDVDDFVEAVDVAYGEYMALARAHF